MKYRELSSSLKSWHSKTVFLAAPPKLSPSLVRWYVQPIIPHHFRWPCIKSSTRLLSRLWCPKRDNLKIQRPDKTYLLPYRQNEQRCRHFRQATVAGGCLIPKVAMKGTTLPRRRTPECPAHRNAREQDKILHNSPMTT